MALVWHTVKGLREGRADQFAAEDGWIHDLTAVSGSVKYWKASAGVAVMMSRSEQDAVDSQQADNVTVAEQDRLDVDRVLKALALVIMDEINLLRIEHGFNVRTTNQIINTIKGRV